jgi:hypothetical protein
MRPLNDYPLSQRGYLEGIDGDWIVVNSSTQPSTATAMLGTASEFAKSIPTIIPSLRDTKELTKSAYHKIQRIDVKKMITKRLWG